MSDLDNSQQSGNSGGISRRTVTKAMAWAVPAIAIAAPVPAFAASGPGPIITPGVACKSPGQSCQTQPGFGYRVPVTIQNPDPTKTVYITAIAINPGNCSNLTTAATTPALPIAIGPGQTRTDVVFVAFASNSANQTCTFNFVVTWGHDAGGNDPEGHAPIPVSINIPGTPPNCPCPPA